MSVIITNVLPTPTTLAHVPYSGQTSMSPQAQQQQQSTVVPNAPQAGMNLFGAMAADMMRAQQPPSQPSNQNNAPKQPPSTPAQPPMNPTPKTPNPNNLGNGNMGLVPKKEAFGGYAAFGDTTDASRTDINKMFVDDKNKYDMSVKLVNYPVGHPLYAPQTLADVRANDSEILVQRENMIFGMALAGGVSVVVLGLLMSSGLMSDTPSGATL